MVLHYVINSTLNVHLYKTTAHLSAKQPQGYLIFKCLNHVHIYISTTTSMHKYTSQMNTWLDIWVIQTHLLFVRHFCRKLLQFPLLRWKQAAQEFHSTVQYTTPTDDRTSAVECRSETFPASHREHSVSWCTAASQTDSHSACKNGRSTNSWTYNTIQTVRHCWNTESWIILQQNGNNNLTPDMDISLHQLVNNNNNWYSFLTLF